VGGDQAVMDIPRVGPIFGREAGLAWKGYETFAQFSVRNKLLVANDWCAACWRGRCRRGGRLVGGAACRLACLQFWVRARGAPRDFEFESASVRLTLAAPPPSPATNQDPHQALWPGHQPRLSSGGDSSSSGGGIRQGQAGRSASAGTVV
jgi:hypothetical protein